MKKLKLILALIAAFTLGEFVTMYRMRPKGQTLESFLKEYFEITGPEIKKSFKAGETFWTDWRASRKLFNEVLQPNQN